MPDAIQERIKRGTVDSIDWKLLEDGLAVTGRGITRAVLTLRPRGGGLPVSLDSQALGWGADQPFRWDAGTAVLYMTFGSLTADQLPTGFYFGELAAYDAQGKHAWSRQPIVILVED